MGFDVSTEGGEPSSAFAQQFTQQLGALLFGDTPIDKTAGLFGSISQLASGENVAATGQSLSQLVQRGTERQASEISGRFGSGLLFGGSPAFNAESRFRAEAAPLEATALNQLELQRLQAILPILGLGGQFGALGTPQAEILAQPNAFLQVLQGLGGVGVGAGSVISGLNPGAIAGVPATG